MYTMDTPSKHIHIHWGLSPNILTKTDISIHIEPIYPFAINLVAKCFDFIKLSFNPSFQALSILGAIILNRGLGISSNEQQLSGMVSDIIFSLRDRIGLEVQPSKCHVPLGSLSIQPCLSVIRTELETPPAATIKID